MKYKFIGIILILIIIIILVIVIGTNYYYGKKFHSDSSNNKVYYFSFYLPNSKLINKCVTCLLKYGTKLNPNKNFNNAKGIKLNYNGIKKYIPELIYFYMNNIFLKTIEDVINIKLNFAPVSEQYRLFLRLYLDGDFLDYHYDNNFTIGKRFTAVIPILANDENTAEFQVKNKDGNTIYKIPISEGVLYNGSKIYHSITKQSKNGIRLAVIIPLYEKYKISAYGQIRKKIRDITYKKLTL